jgi:hypothetical protein
MVVVEEVEVVGMVMEEVLGYERWEGEEGEEDETYVEE